MADSFDPARVNTLFPHELSNSFKSSRIIQVATDCVFDGKTGGYFESSPKSPTDLYGITKSAGEPFSENVMNLRSSLVGREINSKLQLLEWVLAKPQHFEIQGYTNHIWNGLTTFHFSKIVAAVINSELFRWGTHHLIPINVVSKFELISHIAKCFDRKDLLVIPLEADKSIDRSLLTSDLHFNSLLWEQAGFKVMPTVEDMIVTYSKWIEGGK